jgi:hypothetical protein
LSRILPRLLVGHPRHAKAGEISRFEQGADLWHSERSNCP